MTKGDIVVWDDPNYQRDVVGRIRKLYTTQNGDEKAQIMTFGKSRCYAVLVSDLRPATERDLCRRRLYRDSAGRVQRA